MCMERRGATATPRLRLHPKERPQDPSAPALLPIFAQCGVACLATAHVWVEKGTGKEGEGEGESDGDGPRVKQRRGGTHAFSSGQSVSQPTGLKARPVICRQSRRQSGLASGASGPASIHGEEHGHLGMGQAAWGGRRSRREARRGGEYGKGRVWDGKAERASPSHPVPSSPSQSYRTSQASS